MLAIGAIVIGIICWLSSKPKKKGKDILVGVVIVNTGDTLIADTIVVNLYDSFGNEFKNEAISDPGTGVR